MKEPGTQWRRDGWCSRASAMPGGRKGGSWDVGGGLVFLAGNGNNTLLATAPSESSSFNPPKSGDGSLTTSPMR